MKPHLLINNKSSKLLTDSYSIRYNYVVAFLAKGIISEDVIKAITTVLSRQYPQVKYLVRLYANGNVTAKPNEIRMGKGKGSVSHSVCKVKRGQIFLELSCSNYDTAIQVLNSIKSMCPVPINIVIITN